MVNEEIGFYINEMEEKIRFQYEEAKAPLNKSAIMVGFIPVIIGISLSLKHYGMIVKEPCFIFSIILLFISFLLSFILAFLPIFRFRRDPEPNYFINRYYKKGVPLKDSKRWILDRLLESYNENKKLLLREQLILVSIGIFLISGMIHLLLSVWS